MHSDGSHTRGGRRCVLFGTRPCQNGAEHRNHEAGQSAQLPLPLQKQMLVVDEFDITGGVLKIASIDYHLIDDRGLDPFGQFSDTVGKRGVVGHGRLDLNGRNLALFL